MTSKFKLSNNNTLSKSLVLTSSSALQLASSMSALVWSCFDGAARSSSLLGVGFGAVSGLVAIMPACSHLNCFGALTTGFLAGFFAWYGNLSAHS
jgi:ammonia channel protein AmtB